MEGKSLLIKAHHLNGGRVDVCEKNILFTVKKHFYFTFFNVSPFTKYELKKNPSVLKDFLKLSDKQ